MTTRDALHELVDRLPEPEAHRLLETLQDPVLRSYMLAPFDEEPETEEELKGVREAREQGARGELIDDKDLVL